MPDEPRLTYWDAACFTSYINGDPHRLPHLESVLDEALRSKGKALVVTSVLSKVEVAFSVQERAARQPAPKRNTASLRYGLARP
jgi:hypothetical protein